MNKFFAFFNPSKANSLDDEHIDKENEAIDKRNKYIMFMVLIVALGLWGGVYFFSQREEISTTEVNVPEFAPIISTDFSEADTQSATIATQSDVRQQNEVLQEMQKQLEKLQTEISASKDSHAKSMKMVLDESERRLQFAQGEYDMKLKAQNDKWQEKLSVLQQEQFNKDPFGLGQHPKDPSYTPTQANTDPMTTPVAKSPLGIQTFSYHYPNQEKKPPYRRTSKNYVPSGSFVTAVMTGAADANAGVNGQSDTAPITFRAIHDGILPNGKRSRLKNCTFTASVYGEISSNRGIPRLDRMSCIFDDKEKGERILDIPVKGTAFNFGRNGIRGTPVMRNGKIMQMVGISGLFTGLGETAKNASSSQITAPAGVVSTVDPNEAFLNMGGSALENVGSKMADYYIKLAEQYHPIIELKVGAVVNLVFLEGFPLDEDQIAEYEKKLYGDTTQTVAQSVMATYTNPALALMNQQNPNTSPQSQPVNPLIEQLPAQMQAKAQQFNAQQQTNPF